MPLVPCKICRHPVSDRAVICPKCKNKLQDNNSSAFILSPVEMSAEKVNNNYCLASFILGLSCLFFWFFIIPQLTALVLGLIGLSTFNEEVNKNRWMGIIGLLLGVLYLFMSLYKLAVFGVL